MPLAESKNRMAAELFAPLPARYDRLAEVLSLGQNGRWRGALVDHVVAAAPARTLDVATGTGGVAIQLAARAGGSVVGADLTLNMLQQGQRRLASAGLRERIPLAAGRAEELPFPDASFDALTFTYLLRYVDDPAATLRELGRVVKPGGTMASLDFLAPPRPFWRAWWWVYTRGVLPVAGLVDRRPAVVPSGPLPRPQHLRALPPVPGGGDRGGLAARRLRRRPGPHA